MKKYAFLLLATFFSLCLFAQEPKYFDVNHKEISKATFDEKRSTNTVLDIPGDSINHHKLINREEKGKINDRTQLLSFLETASNRKIDPAKPIVIIYYPCQDTCNSTGNPQFVIAANNTLKKDLQNQVKTVPLYVYKTDTGLDKFGKAINWIKDPEQIVEKHFFKHHYPCGSFVVISKSGDYISYFGEYANSYLVEVAKKLNE
ncbi:hypothetical protein G7074_00290 [Pedobacter sp. HDW13]|uniref:hypothetical protein n=1 Tax=unclassified Pedobacter TaxID=2628915 RepID=UPI000F5B0DF9|nr:MULTISPECIES: hypothetical protein [unclassified Pedobacter]QIL37863.1 hypothetical protein G7074_00290 [Pedobacter sp. HDW13]RQO79102.1 hypothetical protein DBR40_05115 [Pedobacter sp. KBW01]